MEEVVEAFPILIDASAHDRQLAWTSHLPQSVASALAKALADRGLAGLSFGPGARDTTRLAASSPEMWIDILLYNREAVAEAIADTELRLAELRGLILSRRRRTAELPHGRSRFSRGARPLRVGGDVRVPGDKSITHRALLFSALARGTSRIHGALTSLDARSTARVLRRLGAEISPLRDGVSVKAKGRGRLRAPDTVLDCGNSGTTARLLLGVLAGHRLSATLTGDSSLRRRPMRRVTAPLSKMGARFQENAGDGLPLTIRGGALVPLRYEMPVSSAQIKSAILLAGLAGDVEVDVREPHGRSRDHTERMLRAFGYEVTEEDGWVGFRPGGRITPFELEVPGDPSSAAFLAGVAILADDGVLRIVHVGVNPTRIGFLTVLRRMGATSRPGRPPNTSASRWPISWFVPRHFEAPKSRRARFLDSSTKSHCSPSSHLGPRARRSFAASASSESRRATGCH